MLYKLAKFLKNNLKENAIDAEPIMISYGLFNLVSYPLWYLFNLYLLAPQTYSNLIVRLVIVLFSSALILKKYWPLKWRPYLPFVWYVTIFVAIPFFGTFMTLNNHFSAAWTLNSLALLILMIFLVDWISYFVLLFLGISLGTCVYFLIAKAPFDFTLDPIPLTPLDIISTYIISLIMGVIFSRKKGLIEREKLQAMKAVGASIAHELRTPLASISGGIEGTKRYLPRLIEGYELAKQQNLPVPHIRADHYQLLSNVLSELEAEIHSAHTVIDMLLVKVNTNIMQSTSHLASIKDCVEEALIRYPFGSDEQKALVHNNVNENFVFRGEKLLIVHVLFNLIKNALYFIQDARKGEIYIWTVRLPEKNVLYFKDTARGIRPDVYPNLFKKFFTNTHNGTGLGLAFCKLVLEKLGGDISCETQEGEYTQFALIFPVFNDEFFS